jgi:alpha-beta hydrolase superfamily lysophospholipase
MVQDRERMPQKEIIKLELLDIEEGPAADGAEQVSLKTNQGSIECRYHAAASGNAAVLWVFGAGGGLGGPAGGVYERLAPKLVGHGIASLQLAYRNPGRFIDCVLDVLLGIGFLRRRERPRVALVGHSFGGSVVINAGISSPSVIAVAALSSQMTGADDIGELSPKPVLLLHGTADEVLSDIGSRELYRLAAEPKELILYPGCSHGLDECRDALDRDLLAWIARVATAETESSPT